MNFEILPTFPQTLLREASGPNLEASLGPSAIRWSARKFDGARTAMPQAGGAVIRSPGTPATHYSTHSKIGGCLAPGSALRISR